MTQRTNHYNSNKNYSNSSFGFTLIELLVVVAIIGILSSIVLTSVNAGRDKARVARAASDLRQLNIVLSLYHSTNNVYPCFDHTWDDTREKAWSAPFISVWPKLPWGNQYHWEHGMGGQIFSISMNAPGQANAAALDKFMDDNNLGTGAIRGDGNRLEYTGMDQTVPLVDCHI